MHGMAKNIPPISRPANMEIDSSPSGVNGPLTAGIIPCGYGNYNLQQVGSTESFGNRVGNRRQ